MKLLSLTLYDRLGASSRLRYWQYIPWLEEAGFDVKAFPLFPDSYVVDLQNGRRNMFDVMRACMRRVRQLLCSEIYDLLWVEKECLPWVPAFFERESLLSRIPYVLDYDDAVFHSYDGNERWLVRRLLGGKHSELMRGAAMVIAGNSYLADFAHNAGARRVEIIPTAIDLHRYFPCDQVPFHSGISIPTVGWIGQRSTGHYLLPLADLFQEFLEEGTGTFIAIGIDSRKLGLPMVSIPWSENSEVDSIRKLDIGIMPLKDGIGERGKCGYKLIQYMACALPVIASPVGVNKQIVEHGVNGFLAESISEWRMALQKLLADEQLRRQMGFAGRDKIKREYCTEVTGPILVGLLQSVLP
jgi:hypothetical protein